jgi:hypothetical protein
MNEGDTSRSFEPNLLDHEKLASGKPIGSCLRGMGRAGISFGPALVPREAEVKAGQSRRSVIAEAG